MGLNETPSSQRLHIGIFVMTHLPNQWDTFVLAAYQAKASGIFM